jgi:dolichol-phosphate mannosyltransferase
VVEQTLPKISLLVPAYNEEENLPELYKQLTDVFSNLPAEMELLIVDDASTDETLAWLQETSRKDRRVRFVSFSRNFGHQAAVTAGLNSATGEAVVVMDADLQDPPQVIPEMLQKWSEGYQVVVGRRVQRDGDNLSKRLFAWIYYRVLAHLSETKIPVDSGDFCLIDRAVVDALNALPERNRYVRGLRAWVGFRHADVLFTRQPRLRGHPKYNFLKSLALSVNGLVSFSSSPLRLAIYAGVGTGILALVLAVLVVYWRFFTNAPLTGYATIITSFLFMGSIQLLLFGIMGEYIGRIYDEVKGRPQYIVKESNVCKIARARVSSTDGVNIPY